MTEKFMLSAAHCSRTKRGDSKIIDPVPKIVRVGEINIGFKVSNVIEFKTILSIDKVKADYFLLDVKRQI